MSDLIIPPQSNRLAALRELSTPELKQSLLGVLRRTVEDVLETAYYILVLEERGEDLTGLKIGLYDHLRKVAHGQLLPEVIVHFAGKPSLIEIIGNLPLPDQKRLAEGEHVRLTVHDPGTGTRTHQMADPLSLTPAQVRQVFARDHIKREDEQALFLAGQHEKARQPIPEQVGQLKLDRERQVATCGRYTFSLADLKAAVAILSK